MVSPKIRIRQFRAEDFPHVVKIFEYGVMHQSKDIRWVDYIRKSLSTDLADIHGTYIAPGGNFWVATTDGDDNSERVVAMIALEMKTNGEGEVRRVSVHHDYHRLGIGRKLLTHIEQWASRRNFKSLMLIASHEQESVLNFYYAFGFQHVDTVNIWEDPNYEGIVMVKAL